MEVNSQIDVEQAAEPHDDRSLAGAREPDGEPGEEAAAAPKSRAEIGSPLDGVRSAERDERAAMEGATSGEAGGKLEIQRTREVGNAARVGAGAGTNNMTMSNKERRRRRREERQRVREARVASSLSVV